MRAVDKFEVVPGSDLGRMVYMAGGRMAAVQDSYATVLVTAGDGVTRLPGPSCIKLTTYRDCGNGVYMIDGESWGHETVGAACAAGAAYVERRTA